MPPMTKEENQFYKGLFIFFCIIISIPCAIWIGYNIVGWVDLVTCSGRFERNLGMEAGSIDDVNIFVNDYVESHVQPGMTRQEVDDVFMAFQDVYLDMTSYITETITIKVCPFPANWIIYSIHYDNSENYDDNGILEYIRREGFD